MNRMDGRGFTDREICQFRSEGMCTPHKQVCNLHHPDQTCWIYDEEAMMKLLEEQKPKCRRCGCSVRVPGLCYDCDYEMRTGRER